MTEPENPRSSLLTFPCEFVIKVFGATSEQFEGQIAKIIRKHKPELPDNAITSRPSNDGKYIALSITLQVENQKELDNIYYDLSANPFVIMTL
jgi:uncharacterized protein